MYACELGPDPCLVDIGLPRLIAGERLPLLIPRKTYSEEFKRDAVAMYEDTDVYTSKDFRKHCHDFLGASRWGQWGASADNALAESFNAALKREVLQNRRCFDLMRSARKEVFAWCVRYNQKRRYSWCKYLSPVEFENRTRGSLSLAA